MTKKKGIGIPSVVQLPGGIRLRPIPFRVTDYDTNGRPLKFEIMPFGTTEADTEKEPKPVFWLFASEEEVRKVTPKEMRR
jgi:hypothetical protein